VRELRQNLSVYLRRVKAGETLEVTERGEIVARLSPTPPRGLSPLDQLIAEGRASPATRSHRDLPPPIRLPPGSPSASEILRQMRDEEDR
jgi:antitoxin (DNA-binding transcriptional repressor) of toxin-antitoxin stability system